MSEQIHLPGERLTHSAPEEEHERTPGVFHESEAFDFRLILWIGVGLAGIAVVLQVVLWWLLGGLERRYTVPSGAVSELAKEDAERPLDQRIDSVPSPRLEGIERPHRPGPIAAARQRAEARMKRYGWVDRRKEIIHVPVDKAMELLLLSKEFGPASTKKKNAEGKP